MPLFAPAYVAYVPSLPSSGYNGQLVYNQSDNSIYMWESGFWALVSVLPYALAAENDDLLLTENGDNLVI